MNPRDPETLSFGRLLAPRLFPGRAASLRRALGAVRELEVGGFLVLAGTARDAERAVRRLQESSRRPLVFWLDAEWGAAQRLEGGLEFPKAREVGAAGDARLARHLGRWTARECLSIGIRGVLAPVLDVDSNPLNPIIGVRAFGRTPALVARMGLAFARGVIAGGGIPVAKHFPGHGDTVQDSHKALPRVEASRALLARRELAPFRAAVRARIPAIMMAHLQVPALDPSGAPSSQSAPVVTGLLRRGWRYRGLVMTDALTMAGALQGITPEEAAVRSLAAGCDLLLDPPDPWKAAAAIRKRLADGNLDPRQVRASLRRLDRLQPA